MNPLYAWDRMKILKFGYNRTQKGHEYEEGLVVAVKNTFEKLCSGADDPMQAAVFVHDNQDPFLDSEYIIQELHFAINTSESNRARDGTE
jgi:hypothetical protein